MKDSEPEDLDDERDELDVLGTTKKKPQLRRDRFFLSKEALRTAKPQRSRPTPQKSDSKQTSYESYLSDTLFPASSSKTPNPRPSLRNFTLNPLNRPKPSLTPLTLKLSLLRKENLAPFRKFTVLGWKDNYYTNLLDWSYDNFVGAGYLNDLCLYNMAIDQEFQSSLYRKFSIGVAGEYLTSVKFCPCEMRVALGYSGGSFKIFDYFKEKTSYIGYHHIQRIGTIEWSSPTILTGSKDQTLKSFDPRTKKLLQLPPEIQKSHSQQICGIKQKGNLFSTGGNDNKVNIYDLRKLKIIDGYSHGAAVKAMAWIGDKVLVTGGGTADKKLKFWGEGRGIFREVDTGSQVCSLVWSAATGEIVSCQGFSLNQIIIWSRKGERRFTFHGHSSRVLYSALSPTGEYLASGAGDQNLKIWKLFPSQEKEEVLLNQQLR